MTIMRYGFLIVESFKIVNLSRVSKSSKKTTKVSALEKSPPCACIVKQFSVFFVATCVLEFQRIQNSKLDGPG